MPIYSTFKYGQKKYGLSNTLVWVLEVDWNNDGSFSGTYELETQRIVSLTIRRGRPNWLTTESDGAARLARMRPGTMQLELDNNDRRFDPFYTSSVLYPNVLPGRDVRLRVRDATADVIYTVFRGMMDDIDLMPPKEKRVVIRVSDGWRLLADRKTTLALATSQTTDVPMGNILNDVGWSSAWGRSLAAGADTIGYIWIDNEYAYDSLHDLVESEQGLCWVGADGKFNFLSRHDLYNRAESLTLTDDVLLDNPEVAKPWESVRNKIRVQAYPVNLSATRTLWTLIDKPLVTPGQTITIWAEFVDTNGRRAAASNVVTPAATTDYTMNSNSDGSGTDLTANFTVTPTIFSGSAKLVITNNGSTSGYVTLFQVRGKSLELQNVSAYVVDDASSQSVYGTRLLRLDLKYQQSTLVAKDLGDFLSSWMAAVKPAARVQMEARPSLQFAYDVGTYLRYNSSYLGLNQRFRIGYIEHKSLGNMQAIQTTWGLEPVDEAQSYWLLGTAGNSELGTTTRFGY
jgi:hypothetical protein